MSKTCRIATVKATGERYLVQQRDLDKGIVHCWGDVISYRGLGTRHDASKRFKDDEVEVTEVPKTIVLVDSLFMQTARKIQKARRG